MTDMSSPTDVPARSAVPFMPLLCLCVYYHDNCCIAVPKRHTLHTCTFASPPPALKATTSPFGNCVLFNSEKMKTKNFVCLCFCCLLSADLQLRACSRYRRQREVICWSALYLFGASCVSIMFYQLHESPQTSRQAEAVKSL